MGRKGATRRDLIQGLWPDKALYGATLLFITALLGLIHGLAMSAIDITLDPNLPALFRSYPPEATALFSAAAAILAYASLRQQRTVLALAGVAAGALSFALLGLGTLLSLVALGFLLMSRAEREDETPATKDLDVDMWPDKALAASVVVLVTGVLTIGWGGALAADTIAFSGYTGDATTFGWLAVAAGLLCLAAAGSLYFQRAPWLGVVACLAGIAALALYVVGPLLSLGALWLIILAKRENEFDGNVRVPASAPAAAGGGGQQ